MCCESHIPRCGLLVVAGRGWLVVGWAIGVVARREGFLAGWTISRTPVMVALFNTACFCRFVSYSVTGVLPGMGIGGTLIWDFM